MAQYWLVKSEASCYSIDDLRRDKRTSWSGVRNYQARNFMRDMKVGELVLFYHSSPKGSGEVPAVVGVARVVAPAHADATALDPKNDHYDPKATKEKPIWECVDIGFVEEFAEPVTLPVIKLNPALAGIMLAQQGSRLSVQPVSETHFKKIVVLGGGKKK